MQTPLLAACLFVLVACSGSSGDSASSESPECPTTQPSPAPSAPPVGGSASAPDAGTIPAAFAPVSGRWHVCSYGWPADGSSDWAIAVSGHTVSLASWLDPSPKTTQTCELDSSTRRCAGDPSVTPAVDIVFSSDGAHFTGLDGATQMIGAVTDGTFTCPAKP